MKEKSIIWDFDGTIYDTYPRILDSFHQIINEKYHLGYSRHELQHMVLIDTKYCANIIAKQHEMNQDELLHEIRAYYEVNNNIDEGVFPSAKAYIHGTQHTVNHYLVTHRDHHSTCQKLHETALDKSFDIILTNDDHFPEKPNPTSFNFIINTSGMPRASFYCIGDRDLDIQAGKNAGITTIFFNTERDRHEHADFNISDHTQLEDILSGKHT